MNRFFVFRLVVAPCCGLLLALLGACGSSSGGDTPAPIAPPSISAQPSSASSTSGSSATFSVLATGDGLSYQWQRSTDTTATAWVNIAGATAASYVISVVDSGLNLIQFRAVITGTAGTVTTSASTLTVTPAVAAAVITVQPSDQSITAGANASFSVTATGTALGYQWQFSLDGNGWTPIEGATGSTLPLTAPSAAISGRRFRVVVSNSAGSITSNPALLTVAAVPAAAQITTQPASVSVVAGQTASFTVVASGNPLPTYQWQVSTDAGVTYADIAGATGATYNTATTVGDNGKRFRVRVSNAGASVLSNAAGLGVSAAAAVPIITTQPSDQSVTQPGTATFSVTAAATPAANFQWQMSTDNGATFSNINGATAASYTTPVTVLADSGKRFRVVLSNTAGTVTSTVVRLTVNAAGGGGPGSGGSAACSPFAVPVGTTVQSTTSNPSNPLATSVTSTAVNNGRVTFNGRQTNEISTVVTLLATTLNIKGYADFDAATGAMVTYGTVTDYSNTAAGVITAVKTTSILTVPFTGYDFTLGPGQSTVAQTQNYVDTEITTINGVAGAPVTKNRTETSTATTFIGLETITVPAGTFNTCRYRDASGFTKWLLVGYGGAVKDSSGAVATSILVNGVPLTRN